MIQLHVYYDYFISFIFHISDLTKLYSYHKLSLRFDRFRSFKIFVSYKNLITFINKSNRDSKNMI